MLKVYQWENETYKEFQNFQIARQDARSYLKKFARHFKTNEPMLSHHVKRNGGGTYFPSYQGVIRLPESTMSLGIVIHEFAHHLTAKTHGPNECHGKKFKRCLKRVYTFAKRYLAV